MRYSRMLIVVSTIEYCRVKRENSFIHYPMTRGCRVVDCCVMEGIYFRHCRSSMSWDPQNHYFQCHGLGSYSRCPKLQEIVVPTYPTNSDHLTLSKLFYCNDNSSFSWNDFHPHFCDPKNVAYAPFEHDYLMLMIHPSSPCSCDSETTSCIRWSIILFDLWPFFTL